jgi:UDP-N-acetylmuramoyl-tripeptide--D-alanyl-D-alanine ligase
VLDDSYNANPASMIAGLRLLARYHGRKLAVLGHMAELGADSEAGHRLVGREAARLQVSLVAVGELTRPLIDAFKEQGGQDGVHAPTRADALALVRHRLAGGRTTVLVKGSRSAGLEWIISQLPVTGGAQA